jgi:hypothetical protein
VGAPEPAQPDGQGAGYGGLRARHRAIINILTTNLLTLSLKLTKKLLYSSFYTIPTLIHLEQFITFYMLHILYFIFNQTIQTHLLY